MWYLIVILVDLFILNALAERRVISRYGWVGSIAGTITLPLYSLADWIAKDNRRLVPALILAHVLVLGLITGWGA